MITRPRPTSPGRLFRPARGITMIEAVLALVVAGLMLVAALRLVASANMRARFTVDELAAQTLALDLASEMIDLPVMDQEKTAVFGIEAADVPVADERTAFNDIDDYHNLADVTIVDKSGTVIDGFDAYQREVTVSRINRNNPNNDSGSNTGLVRVDITVTRDGRVLETISFLTAGKLAGGEDFVERIR